jgi:hypothetical protein
MKLYLANGQYVGTQAEARSIDKAFDPALDVQEVPTDKEGLIRFLNELTTMTHDRAEDQFETVVARQDPVVERTPAAIMSVEQLVEQTSITAQIDIAVGILDRVNATLRSPMFAPVADPVMPEVAAMGEEEGGEVDPLFG